MREYMKEAQQNYDESRKSGERKVVEFAICPETFKKPCQLCTYCKAILFHKDRYNAEQIERARDINRKKKFYANIYLATNPSEVLVFEYGPLIGDKLSAYEMAPDSDLKGFTDPNTGRNLRITKIPNPNPKLTKYDVEPRLTASPIIDRNVLKKMYDLDNVVEMIKAKQIQTLYQSKLADGTTEIRVLPSWLGPQYASVFQLHFFLHYGVNEEEMAAIQRGELNPLEDILQEKTIVIPKQMIIPTTATHQAHSNWDEPASTRTMQEPITIQTTTTHLPTGKSNKPVCFGTYDDEEPDCTMSCKKLTQAIFEECKTNTEGRLAARVAAKGLYR